MGVLYNSRIVTDGLVFCLDAGDKMSYPGAGTTWTDLSKNKNNGTLTNGPTFDSANGGSIVFDGTDDKITTNQNLHPANFTAGGWLKMASNQQLQYDGFINNRIFGGGVGGFVIEQDTASSFSIFIGIGGVWRSLGGVSYTENQPTMLLWSYDGNNITAYKDGIFHSSVAQTGSISYQSTTPIIGAEGNVRYLKASIYNVIVYNRALSASEVQQNYKATKGRFGL